MAQIQIPAYLTSDKEGTGLQWATDKWNATHPNNQKTVLTFWLMVARGVVNFWYNQNIKEQAEAASNAVIVANPPDFTPPSDLVLPGV